MIALWALLLACAPPGDFTPAEGRGAPPANTRGLERDQTGPWAVRLELAWSEDGQSFTRSGEVLADQAGVPAVVALADGTLLVYYMAWQDGQNFNAVVVRRSDGTRQFRRVTLSGADGDQPNWPDPSVVALPDGRLRMYYLGVQGTSHTVRSAVSTDGVAFVAEPGVRWAPKTSGEPLRDPLALRVGQGWMLWVGPPGTPAGWSEDGLSFRAAAAPTLDGQSFMPVSAVNLPGGAVRLLGYRERALGELVPLVSTDLRRWRQERGAPHPDGPRVRGNGEHAVARTADGRWVMVLSTPMPE